MTFETVLLITGIIIALMLGVFKLFDYFTKKKLDGELLKILHRIESGVNVVKTENHELYSMHNHFDTDGLPSWYIPRRWGDTQEKMVEVMQKISQTLEIVSKSQENMSEILRNIGIEKRKK